MKRAGSIILLVMLLVTACASAQPRVGSHPTLGDQYGVRAAIIEASMNEGGIVWNQTAIDSLGLDFEYKWTGNDAVRKDWRYSPVTDGAGSGAECTCADPSDCDGSCGTGCGCGSGPEPERAPCGALTSDCDCRFCPSDCDPGGC